MKNRILAIAAIYLLGASAVFAQQSNPGSNPSGVSLMLLKQFAYQTDVGTSKFSSSIAFDKGIVYISTPDLTVLATPSLTSNVPPRTIFHTTGMSVNRVSVYDHVVYVMSTPRPDLPDHTLFQSTDRGKSFQTIDAGLWFCFDWCRYMGLTQLFAEDGLLFVNAGGGKNLLVSNDNGETFRALSGAVEYQPCYDSPFDINGLTVLQGGECSVDFPFLDVGQLSEDKLGMDIPLHPVQMPYLSNRKINAIQHKPHTSLVLASPEGALLRSVDGGQSFEFVLEYPDSGPYYPYVGTILFPSRQDLAPIGGINTAGETSPYLAYGTGDGLNWTDISYLLGSVEQGIVTDLAEDKDGRIIAVVVNASKKIVSIYQVVIPSPAPSN